MSRQEKYPYTTIEKAPVVDDLRSAFKDGALSLAEWMLTNGVRNSGNEIWILEYDPINEIIDPKAYTTEQLFSLYMEEVNKKP